MPLPNIVLGRVARCKAKAKHSGERCKNLCVAGSPVCRMHGFHKRVARLYGKNNPNFKHGEETYAAIKKRNEKNLQFALLEQLGWHLNMFTGTRTRGRKPSGYRAMDLSDPDELSEIILKTLPKAKSKI